MYEEDDHYNNFRNDYEEEQFNPISKDDLMWRMLSFLGIIVFVGLIACILLNATGCTPTPPPPTANGVVIPASVAPIVNHLIATSHPAVAAVVQSLPAQIRAITSAPPDLKPVSHWTNFLIVLGIIIAAAATGVYFLEAALHKIAVAIGAGGVALTAFSLFVHTTLWLAPYVSGGLLLTAVGLAVYEVLRNKTVLNADVTAAVTPNKAPLFPDLANKVVAPPAPVKPAASLGVLGTVEADIKAVEKKL